MRARIQVRTTFPGRGLSRAGGVGGLIIAAMLAMSSPTSANEPAEDMAAEVANDLGRGNFEAIVAMMNDEMAKRVPAAQLALGWASIIKAMGPFRSVGSPRTEEARGAILVRSPLFFERGVLDLKLAIASGKISGLFFTPHEDPVAQWLPPSYVNTHAFHEIEVKLGPGDAALPGTLSLPNAPERAPVLILVHGSGPQDRDESIGPNRPFRDLAQGLASLGVAVLRYDKSTKVHPEAFAKLEAPTVKEETIDDAVRAAAWLRTRPEIDGDRIFVLGHSLGGTVAPRIAEADPNIAGIVMLAGAARSLPDIIAEQTEFLSKRSGPLSEEAARSIEELRREARRAKAARPGDKGPPFMGVPLSYWADLNAYDPAATAARLKIPVLALQGGRDYQVTRDDFSLFQAAFTGHANARCVWLRELNHLFMTGEGPASPDDYKIPGHVEAEVVELVSEFVLKR